MAARAASCLCSPQDTGRMPRCFPFAAPCLRLFWLRTSNLPLIPTANGLPRAEIAHTYDILGATRTACSASAPKHASPGRKRPQGLRDRGRARPIGPSHTYNPLNGASSPHTYRCLCLFRHSASRSREGKLASSSSWHCGPQLDRAMTLSREDGVLLAPAAVQLVTPLSGKGGTVRVPAGDNNS